MSEKQYFGLSRFQLCICVCLLLAVCSLFTPYPALLVRELKGTQTSAEQQTPDTIDNTTAPQQPTPDISREQTAQAMQNHDPVFPSLDIMQSLSLPTIEYPPFPPVMPISPAEGSFTNIYELARGFNLKTQVNFLPGTTAAQDRQEKSNYQMTLTLNIRQPKAVDSLHRLSVLNEHLPRLLPGLPDLLKHARVSPYYGQLYAKKQTEVRKNLASLTKLLDRHNYYDLETILELQHPQSKRKVLWLQGEMDVVSDGSDGDRLATMPDKILKSSYYQPSTSYRWQKRTKQANPLLKPWQQRLADYKKELKRTTDKAPVQRKIDHAQRVIEELKRYSFLISEYDPFIVLPLGVVNRQGDYSPQFGDYAVVIVGDKLFPAIVGDAGPRHKTGEASLRLTKTINPKSGIYSRPVSDLTVSYLVFPGTAPTVPGPPDYELMHARCSELLQEIGGIGQHYHLHKWQDLLAPKSPPVPKPASPVSGTSATDNNSILTPTDNSPQNGTPTVKENSATDSLNESLDKRNMLPASSSLTPLPTTP